MSPKVVRPNMPRGQFRGIRLSLVDDVAYQALTPAAKLVYLTLIVSMGPLGLEIRYREPAAHELALRTGYRYKLVIKCLKELETSGWVRWDRNLVWAVRLLGEDGALQPNNGNHRSSVQKALDRLPSDSPLVAQFLDRYGGTWMLDAHGIQVPSISGGHPIERPSGSHRDNKDGEAEKEGEREELGKKRLIPRRPETAHVRSRNNSSADAELDTVAGSATGEKGHTWLTPYFADWVSRYGGEPAVGQLSKLLRPLHVSHGEPVVRAAWQRYLIETEPRFASPSRFAQTFGTWTGEKPTLSTSEARKQLALANWSPPPTACEQREAGRITSAEAGGR
jgi:hypothetical protein